MAEVITIVTDMGNGGRLCSECKADLDQGDPLVKVGSHCPKCGEEFTKIWPAEPYRFGGSDF